MRHATRSNHDLREMIDAQYDGRREHGCELDDRKSALPQPYRDWYLTKLPLIAGGFLPAWAPGDWRYELYADSGDFTAPTSR